MPGKKVAIRIAVDARQERCARLARARVGLQHALTGGRQIAVVAHGELDKAVQLLAAEAAVPVLGGPRTAVQATVLKGGGHVARWLNGRAAGTAGQQDAEHASRREPLASCCAVG